MKINKGYLLSIVFLCVIFTNLSKAKSNEYTEGYAQAIIDNYFPETSTSVHFDHKKKSLKIIVHSDIPVEEEKNLLQNRLDALQFVDTTEILVKPKAEDKAQPATKRKVSMNEILPNGALFQAPVADPRWPAFSAAYQYHNNNNYGRSIFGLSFGENLALYRRQNDSYAWEVGLQAGLFGALDMGSTPTRLINSDYMVGVNYTYQYKNWGNFFSFYHLSSHVGDEYLISNSSINRINLSYESLNWVTSIQLGQFRPYIGLDYMVHKDPSSIKPFSFTVGVDYEGQETFIFKTARFIGGLHLHSWQENKYKATTNVRGGIQFENPVWYGRTLKFLVDYSHGPSRQGQFYVHTQDYIGLMMVVSV